MLSETQMRIMIRAVKIRLDRGENLEAILESYPKLMVTEREEISKEIQPLSNNTNY